MVRGPKRQATARVAMWRDLNTQFVVDSARARVAHDQALGGDGRSVNDREIEELGRMLPGVVGLEWIRQGQAGCPVSLEDAAEQAAEEIGSRLDTLVLSGEFETALRLATFGFAEILETQTQVQTAQETLLASRLDPPEFDTSTADIAAQLREWAVVAASESRTPLLRSPGNHSAWRSNLATA